MKFFKLFSLVLVFFIACITVASAQDYDALKNKLMANIPTTFEGKEIHPRTLNLAHAIVNQICEDMRKMKFDEKKAYWLHASDYFLYDANSNKRIGNTYYIVYKTADDKAIGTYLMNCENPVNNRMMHTSYNYYGGSYKIKEKVKMSMFSNIVCKETRRDIQRF